MLEVAVHDGDQLVEGALVGERFPALAAVEREPVGPDAEGVSRKRGSGPNSSARARMRCPPRTVMVSPGVAWPASRRA